MGKRFSVNLLPLLFLKEKNKKERGAGKKMEKIPKQGQLINGHEVGKINFDDEGRMFSFSCRTCRGAVGHLYVKETGKFDTSKKSRPDY